MKIIFHLRAIVRAMCGAAAFAAVVAAMLTAYPAGVGGDELPRSGWYEKRWLPGGKVIVIVDNGTDLCRTLFEQAMQLAEAGEDWCSLPLPDRKAGISLPKWMPENPDDHRDLLRIVTPRAVFDDLDIRQRLMAEIPGLDYAGANEEFWRRYGESLLNVLRRGEATLESIQYDFERDGSPEKIYRMTGLELAMDTFDQRRRPDLWKVRHCAPLKPESPAAHVLFLGPADSKKFYPYLDGYGKSDELFYYGPGLYHIFSSPKSFDFGDVVTSIAVSGERREVFYRQACGATTAPPDLPPPPDIPPLR
jgi:hypothetical protein